jgi:hypothetical protein
MVHVSNPTHAGALHLLLSVAGRSTAAAASALQPAMRLLLSADCCCPATASCCCRLLTAAPLAPALATPASHVQHGRAGTPDMGVPIASVITAQPSSVHWRPNSNEPSRWRKSVTSRCCGRETGASPGRCYHDDAESFYL